MMKKILIIDDKQEPRDSGNFIADELIERLCEFKNIVDIKKSPTSHFEWDDAGNECNPLFNVEEYSYIFIHHSQAGDSLMPSNISDKMKLIFKEKLVLFSGNINECILNKENGDFVFRSLRRNKFNDHIKEFISKSVVLNEWVIEILFYDEFENSLIAKLMQMEDRGLSRNEILMSKEFNQFLLLKHVANESSKYKSITRENCDLITELRNL